MLDTQTRLVCRLSSQDHTLQSLTHSSRTFRVFLPEIRVAHHVHMHRSRFIIMVSSHFFLTTDRRPRTPHVNLQPPAMQPPAALGTGCRARATIDFGVTKYRKMERRALHLFSSPTAQRTRHPHVWSRDNCISVQIPFKVCLCLRNIFMCTRYEHEKQDIEMSSGVTFRSSHVRTHAFRTDVGRGRTPPLP